MTGPRVHYKPKILAVMEKGPVTCRDLADELGWTPKRASSWLQLLIYQGLVIKTDKRVPATVPNRYMALFVLREC